MKKRRRSTDGTYPAPRRGVLADVEDLGAALIDKQVTLRTADLEFPGVVTSVSWDSGDGFYYVRVEVTQAGRKVLMMARRRCPQCARPFLPSDPRQQFCTPTCANRARQQRFASKHPERKPA